MQFIKIAKVSDFENKRFIRFSILARKIAIFKEEDGSFYGIEFACKHQNWDLSTGTLQGDVIECPRHNWQYNIRTGECLNKDSLRLRKYAVKVEGDDVYVSTAPLE